MGIQWQNETQLMDLDFTKNITLLVETKKNLWDMMTHLERKVGKIGLRINSIERKMILVRNVKMNMPIVIGCQPIKEVQQFTYLGIMLSCNGEVKTDINCRIGKVSTEFQRLYSI